MPKRKFWSILIAIVLVAFCLRLGVAAKFQGLSSPPKFSANPDQVDYETLGTRLANGQGFTHADGSPTAFRPPGTPALIGAVYSVLGQNRAAVRVLFCLLSALTCLAAGLLAAEVFGNLAGLVAALLLAFLPNHFYYGQHMLSEAPFAFEITLASLWLVLGRRAGAHPFFDLGAGLMFGVACLTRPQASLCIPLLGLFALFGRTESRRAALTSFGRMAAAFLLVVMPWSVRNQVELGTLAPTTLSGQVFWGAHNPVVAADPDHVGAWIPIEGLVDAQHPLPANEVAATKAAWGYGLDFLRENPGQILRFQFWKLVRHFSPFQWTENRMVYWSFALGWIVLGPLALAGLLIGWRRARIGVLLLLVAPASTLVTSFVFYGSGRFRDADSGLYVVLAAAALTACAPRAWKVWAGETQPAG